MAENAAASRRKSSVSGEKRIRTHFGCSWCLLLTTHTKVQKNAWVRDVWKCDGCGERTLRCKTAKCPHFACGTKLWDEDYCAICQERLTDFKEVKRVDLVRRGSDSSIPGWCSWCFQSKIHLLVQRNVFSRNMYQCVGCSKHTLPCRKCSEALARSTAQWNDDLCAQCGGLIREWGDESASDYVGRNGWCPACTLVTTHRLFSKHLFAPDTFQCVLCQTLCVACQKCEKGSLPAEHDENTECAMCANPKAAKLLTGANRAAQRRVSVSDIKPPEITGRERKNSATSSSGGDLFRRRVAQMAHLRTFKKDEVVLTEGGHSNSFFLVYHGSVRVEKKIDGKQKLLATLGQDETLGEMSFLLEGGIVTATVVANDDDVQLYTLDGADMDRHQRSKLPGCDKFSEWFFEFLAKKLAARLRQSSTDKTSATGFVAAPEKPPEQEQPAVVDYHNKFGIPSAETKLAEYPCQSSGTVLVKRNGLLLLFDRHVCFYGHAFGTEAKTCIAVGDVLDVKLDDKGNLILYYESGNKEVNVQFKLESAIVAKQALKHIEDMLERDVREETAEKTTVVSSDSQQTRETQAALEAMLTDARTMTFSMNQVIIKEACSEQCLYQVFKGSVRVEKNDKVLAYLPEGEIFGEISFLGGGGASASILADENKVQVSVLDGTAVRERISTNALLAGYFYRLLATSLAERLRKTTSAVLAKKETPEDIFRNRFIQMGNRRVYSAQQVLLREGTNSRVFLLITAGTVSVEKVIDGAPRVLAKLGLNETLGEMSFLQGLPTAATVRALSEEVEVYAVDGEDMEKFQDTPGCEKFSEWLYNYLANKLAARLRTSTAQKVSNSGVGSASKPALEKAAAETKTVDLYEMFDIPTTEALLGEFVCSFGKKGVGGRPKGKLSLFSHFVVLYGTSTIGSSKMCLKIEKVVDVGLDDKGTLLINCEDKTVKVYLKGEGKNNEALSVLSKMISARKETKQAALTHKTNVNSLSDLWGKCDTQQLTLDESILKQGQTANARIFIVQSGSVRVEKDGKSVAVLGEEQIFGEMSFFAQQVVSASVVANEDEVTLLVIDVPSLQDRISEDTLLAGRFYRFLACVLAERLRKISS